MQIDNHWVPSRYNVISNPSEQDMILYNSYTGAMVNVTSEEKNEVLRLLNRNGVAFEQSEIFEQLTENGFLVPEHVNEDLRAKFLSQSLHRTDILHLIVMPTEACNFRCTYCYQDFQRNKMKPAIVKGLKQLFADKARTIKSAGISWFGGEPLLALDIIEELSESFLAAAAQREIEYHAEISTNGYLLSGDTFKRLLQLKVSRFMITLDGHSETHDKKRHLAGGGSTFSQIFENLKQIQQFDDPFEIDIRVNFDMENLDEIPEFVKFLGNHFAGDQRFQVFFRPVGKWGGKNDDRLPICDDRLAETKIWEFTEQGIKEQLGMSQTIENLLSPGGSVCYAAKPFSLVVGSNGNLHKCTCALDAPVNQVGHLGEDGVANLDYDKFAQWVSSGDDQDSVCRTCFFRPSCQGNHCPLYRMETGKRPCPYEKRKIQRVLNTIWQTHNTHERG